MTRTGTGTRPRYGTREGIDSPDLIRLRTDVHLLEGRVERLEQYVEEQREQKIAAMRAGTERLMRWTTMGMIIVAVAAWSMVIAFHLAG